MNRSLQCSLIVAVVVIGMAGPFASRAECEEPMRTPLSNYTLQSRKLAAGVWGGEHIGLQVTANDATVEYDCGHGKISGRIILDRQGRFEVSGTHFEEHGGPVRESEQLNSYPVRFKGRVSGKRMRLTVTNSVTKKVLGVYTLGRGQQPDLVKCR